MLNDGKVFQRMCEPITPDVKLALRYIYEIADELGEQPIYVWNYIERAFVAGRKSCVK